MSFKALSDAEQQRLLDEIGVSVPIAGPPPPVVPSSTNVGGLPTDFGAQMAQGLAPMLLELQASVAAMSAAVKKRPRDSSDSDSDDGDDETRLEKLCQFGGLQLVKKKKMALGDFHRENEIEKIRSAQRIRKLAGFGKWELLWNQTLEEQTTLLVQLENIQHEKLKGRLSASKAVMCDSYERTIHTQLMGIKERVEVLGECCKLASGVRGGTEEAEVVYSLYVEKLSGCSESKLLIKLRTEAKGRLKWQKEMSMLEAVAHMGSGSQHGKGSQLQGGGHGGAPRDLPGAQRPPPRGGKPGGKGGSSSFVMKWVEGTHFDASLAGVKAPSPDKFPGFYQARLDSSSNGIVHSAGWEGECGACGATGHSHSECPARRWTVNGQEYVNVRWLYEKGFCNAQRPMHTI